MKLTDVFNSGQLKNSNTQTTGSQSVSGSAQNASVGRQIQALAPGQTLQGEVVARDGNQVQIKVAEDFILEAKVDANINLEVGKTMTFEVRNNGQTLQLSPLFANTATEANALRALEMASLPVTQDTLAMTGLMMEAGLPIDKNSLQQMFRELNAYPQANVSDVVDLHRLGLPINEDNLEQIQSYKNLTHQLVDGMHAVQSGLGETIGNMVAEGNVEGAAGMFREVLKLVQGITDGSGNAEADGATADTGNANAGVPVEGGSENAAQSPAGEVQNAVQGKMDSAVMDMVKGLTDGAASAGKTSYVIIDGSVVEHTSSVEGEDAVNVHQNNIAATQAETGAKSAVDMLQEALTNTVKNVNGSDAELLQQLNQILRGGNLTEQAKALEALLARGLQDGNKVLLETVLTDKGVHKLLADGLSRLWTIAPEEVADSGKVEELYSRLSRQLKDLSHILEQNGQNQSTAFKAVSNMSQNVDFLQQLNQAYTYVQLPLRMQNGETHGELYVYTNKRNLSAKEGKISALLHLDMEHLGPVDVYVAMQAEHVNTRFYVQDEEMLDFLEQHMDILTQRLQKRGYNCDFAMQVKGETAKESKAGAGESGLGGLLVKEQAQPIARYAFDVRA